jgi:two-component system sensor histidine kinase HydH
MWKLSSEGVWARWGLLASACVLGVALILASWSNYRSARAATSALHAGQARIFERAIMGTLRPGLDHEDPPAVQVGLDSLLAQQSADGLRYVALLDSEDRIIAVAGEPAAGPSMEFSPSGDDPGFRLTQVGSRVRMSLMRPRFTAPPPGMERDPRRSPRHGGVIFEFEPLVATRLMEQARGLLAFGLAAAVVMMLVAGVSWGMSRRYERAKRHLEQERRLSLLGEMSAVLAHEIRNPLASLKGHAQLLAEHLPADSPDRRKADRVVMESSRLEALTSDLLDFVRVGPLELAPVPPVPILQASIEEVAGGGFDLRREQAPSSWPLDAARVRQVFINVLRNAHQASRPSDARPEVGLRVEGDLLVVTVRDHGEGLPKGQEERIFDPFFTTRTTGTGLGLAVARRIVELHGGTLTAANHPQGGAVFRIALPR